MADANDYYTKEAIQKRVFGYGSFVTGDRIAPHTYHEVDDYVYEIRAAAETGDMGFLHRVAHCLMRQVQQRFYQKGIDDAKSDIRKKLGL